MPTYMSGTLVRSKVTFTDVTGAVNDPGTITLKYKLGSAAVVTVTYPAAPIIKESTGVYHADFDTTGWAGPGERFDRQEWIGTGAVIAISADSWLVRPPEL